jgi:hypothetical protein
VKRETKRAFAATVTRRASAGQVADVARPRAAPRRPHGHDDEAPSRLLRGDTPTSRRLYVITYCQDGHWRPTHSRWAPACARCARPRDSRCATCPNARGQRADALAGRARRDEPDAPVPSASPPASTCGCRSSCASTRAGLGRGRAGRERRKGRRDAGPPLRGADPAAARPAGRGLAPRARPGARTGGAGDPPMHEPGSRETRSSSAARSSSCATASATSSPTGDCVTFDADLPHTSRTPARPAALLAVVRRGLRRS